MPSKTLSRDELYALVWSTPMRLLAKDFGLSDVGLAKICRKHEIPTPPRGYWAKKSHGKQILQAPLLPSTASVTITITEQPPALSESPASVRPSAKDPIIAGLIAEAGKPENKVAVAETLHRPHAAVSLARDGLLKAAPDKYGLFSPPRPGLNITVSKSAVNRAMRIMNALLKHLERYSLKITETGDSWRRELSFVIMGVEFDLRLREKTKKQDHVPTAAEEREKAEYQYFSGVPSYDYLPTGVLELRLSSGFSWIDKGDHRIEEDLTDVVITALKMVDWAKTARAEREREERLEQEREDRRRKLERRREKERARIKKLVRRAKAWQKSLLLRGYITAVRAHASKDGDIEAGGKMERWLKWAADQADRIDPFTTSPPSVLDYDPEVDR